MPAQDCVGRHDGRDLLQHATPKPMPQFGEAAPLAVIQAESLPFEPRLEDAFSSHKNAMMLSCSCRSQLHNIATKNGNGNTSEVYVGVTRSSFGTVRAHAAV